MSADHIACVVLASGLSRRFGSEDKLSAQLQGIPLLNHALQAIELIRFGQVYIVAKSEGTGHAKWIVNSAPELGQGHALRLGLKAVKTDGWKTVVVMLGDMPMVSTDNVRKLIDESRGNQSVISMSGSTRLPPALFNEAAIDLILSQKSGLGAKVIFDQLDLKAVPISVEAAMDVDTPEDLARVSAILKARQS